jgi:hypothetical protein
MRSTRLTGFVLVLLILDVLAAPDEAWARWRLGRGSGRSCSRQRPPMPSCLPSVGEPERQVADTEDLPDRTDEILIISGHLDRADVIAIQRAILGHSRHLKLTSNERIKHITVKSPETVEVWTLTVKSPASEGGYVVSLNRTSGRWIIASAASFIADGMPPERPPGY